MWPWAWAAVPAGRAGTSSSPLSGNSGAGAHGVEMGDRRQSQGGRSSQEQRGLGLTLSQLRAEAGPDSGVTILSHFPHGGTPRSGREGIPPPPQPWSFSHRDIATGRCQRRSESVWVWTGRSRLGPSVDKASPPTVKVMSRLEPPAHIRRLTASLGFLSGCLDRTGPGLSPAQGFP